MRPLSKSVKDLPLNQIPEIKDDEASSNYQVSEAAQISKSVNNINEKKKENQSDDINERESFEIDTREPAPPTK